MFCKYCGSKLVDGAAFCHECGKATLEQPVTPPPPPPVPPVQPVKPEPVPRVQIVYQAPVPPTQPEAPQNVPPVQYTYTIPGQAAAPQQAQQETLAQQALTFGILGLSLSMIGVPGIVFSSIAANKANVYKKLTGELTGKTLTGYRLAKAGKIVSIIMAVIWTIVAMALQGEISYEFNNPFEHFSF